jgi:hypothetical protein
VMWKDDRGRLIGRKVKWRLTSKHCLVLQSDIWKHEYKNIKKICTSHFAFCKGVKLGFSRQGKTHRLGVSGNRVLREIPGPRRGEVTGDWRKLRNEELHSSHSSLKVIMVNKPRATGWSGHVGDQKCTQNFS